MKRAFLIVILFIMFSCVSDNVKRGDLFRPVRSIPKGMALVYIYRPTYWAQFDTYVMYANNVPVIELPANSYYPYFTRPGRIVFSNKTGGAKKQVVLNAAAGGVYYLITSVSPGFFTYIPQFSFVSAKEGLEDLKKLNIAIKVNPGK